TAPAPATSLAEAASGACVTEISQTTFAMRLNCSLKFPLVYRATHRCHSERSEESLIIQQPICNTELFRFAQHDNAVMNEPQSATKEIQKWTRINVILA